MDCQAFRFKTGNQQLQGVIIQFYTVPTQVLQPLVYIQQLDLRVVGIQMSTTADKTGYIFGFDTVLFQALK